MKARTNLSKLSALAAGVFTFAVAGAAEARPPWVGEGKPSAPPTVPAGLVVKCLQGPTVTTAAAICPVLKWDGHTYWAFSFADNRESLAIVAYDAQNRLNLRWDVAGARYLNAITVDSTAKTVTFVGQNSKKITRTWDQLAPAPAVIPLTPISQVPPMPSDVKFGCANASGAPTPTTCPTMQWGNYTYWVFDYADNRNAMVVVAYDAYKGMIKTWNLNGVKGIRSIYANVTTKRVEFTGTGPKASLPWAELFVPQNPRWERRAGPPGATITQISVGNEGWVWALDTTGVPWRWNGKDWIKGTGTVSAISATPDNSLWMTNAGNNYSAGRYKYATHQWVANVSAGMRLITGVDANKAYAIDADANNYEWDGSKWVKKGCCVTQLEAGGDGTLWAIHSFNNNAGIRWTGTGWVQSSPEGRGIPYGMTRVTVGDAKNLWALDGAGQPHYWDATNAWIGVPGQLKDISTAPDMTTWGLNSLGELYQWMQ